MNIVGGPVTAFLELIAENIKEGICIAEIGCFQGETTIHYAPLIKKYNGKIILIDWFHGASQDTVLSEPTPHAYQPDESIIYNNLINNLKEIDCLDVVTIMKGKTHDELPKIEDKSLDICFIDADHRYSGVYKDIEISLKKIKDKGILCGHDCEDINLAGQFTKEQTEVDYYNRVHAGVIQAVYDHFGKNITIKHGSTHNLYNNAQQIPIWIKND